MIALKQNRPNSCLSCPCLETLAGIPSDNGKIYVTRYCRAAYKEICVFEEESIPETFYNFNIPTWCPWIEIGVKNND